MRRISLANVFPETISSVVEARGDELSSRKSFGLFLFGGGAFRRCRGGVCLVFWCARGFLRKWFNVFAVFIGSSGIAFGMDRWMALNGSRPTIWHRLSGRHREKKPFEKVFLECALKPGAGENYGFVLCKNAFFC